MQIIQKQVGKGGKTMIRTERETSNKSEMGGLTPTTSMMTFIIRAWSSNQSERLSESMAGQLRRDAVCGRRSVNARLRDRQCTCGKNTCTYSQHRAHDSPARDKGHSIMKHGHFSGRRVLHTWACTYKELHNM